MSIPEPILWKQVMHQGIYIPLFNAPGLGMSDRITNEKELRNEIVRAPIIVETRLPEMDLANEWPRASHLAFPFEMFLIELPDLNTATTIKSHFGVLLEAKRPAQQDGGWHVAGVCFAAIATAKPVVFGMFDFQADSSGTPLHNTLSCRSIALEAATSESNEAAAAATTRALAAVANTLETLGAKNVSLKARENDEKQCRIARKRHGPSAHQYRFHTLIVRPPGAKSTSPGIDIDIMPHHLCRGHYKHYGPAAIHGHPDGQDRGLLFGKISGKFYDPPCEKGNKKNGVIEKTYAVTKASEAA